MDAAESAPIAGTALNAVLNLRLFIIASLLPATALRSLWPLVYSTVLCSISLGLNNQRLLACCYVLCARLCGGSQFGIVTIFAYRPGLGLMTPTRSRQKNTAFVRGPMRYEDHACNSLRHASARFLDPDPGLVTTTTGAECLASPAKAVSSISENSDQVPIALAIADTLFSCHRENLHCDGSYPRTQATAEPLAGIQRGNFSAARSLLGHPLLPSKPNSTFFSVVIN